MTFTEILYYIFIMPLQIFFEMVFSIFNSGVSNPGWAIIALSMAMNMLVLPLYRRADALQDEERDIEARLKKGVEHIKKTFKGDEKMMMLQTYYRQNDYSPLNVFKNSLSLFLEIPFFIAAYNFLAHLDLLNGVRFGVISDLGAPDALLTIGGCSINVLPFVMTAVNLVSCVIFTKGYPLKTKIQLYGMAVFFMVFLYNSPAGLVFYWTLNNIFNLVKTILYKINNPQKVIVQIFFVLGLLLFACGIYNYCMGYGRQPAILWGVVCIIMDGLYYRLQNRANRQTEEPNTTTDGWIFFSCAMFLTVLIGLVIPSAVMHSSPQEFFDSKLNPLWYIVGTVCLAFGTFVFWAGVFYRLADSVGRKRFELVLWMTAGIAAVDYMFFGKKLGILFNTLQYENGISFSLFEIIVNIILVLIIGGILIFTYKRIKKYICQIAGIATLALVVMVAHNIFDINISLAEAERSVGQQTGANRSLFTLSKHGKNVIVIMLDRAMNEYIPYLLAEKPELKQMYSGFTYYPNTISFGPTTNIGTPALFGGYEYTPEEINKRSSETLCQKQNEALKVMPVLFDQHGYKVTVTDPPYAGYKWIPDLSIFDDHPYIKKQLSFGKFNGAVSENKRNFFIFGIMKAAPVFAQKFFYDHARYFDNNAKFSGSQKIEDKYTAHGYSASFMKAFNVLKKLPVLTKIMDNNINTFAMMTNDTTHEPALLQEPDYLPVMNVDNRRFEETNHDRFMVNGRVLKMQTEQQVIHYQSNMAALLQIGKWLEFLKEKGVYDNTRIIIVADHGRGLNHLELMVFDSAKRGIGSIESFYPLLLVKDFNRKEFKVSEEFMTNGDVPTLAVKDIIDKPVNPFTGKAISDEEKYAHEQHVFLSSDWDVEKNNGNTFLPGVWLAVQNDMRKPSNWRVIPDPSGN